MSNAVNRASPTFGNALGYFLILYAVINGYVPEQHQPEAVAMAGIICTNILMETRLFLAWMGQFFARKKDE